MTPRPLIIILATVAALTGPTAPAVAGHADTLRSLYGELDEMCRGWPGSDPHTDQACDARLKAGRALKEIGVCLLGMGADSHWGRCR